MGWWETEDCKIPVLVGFACYHCFDCCWYYCYCCGGCCFPALEYVILLQPQDRLSYFSVSSTCLWNTDYKQEAAQNVTWAQENKGQMLNPVYARGWGGGALSWHKAFSSDVRQPFIHYPHPHPYPKTSDFSVLGEPRATDQSTRQKHCEVCFT